MKNKIYPFKDIVKEIESKNYKYSREKIENEILRLFDDR
jgi:DNA-directed RNA polymerase delta subunit